MATGKADVQKNIDIVGTFPSPLVPQKKKLTLEYGYQYAEAMFREFRGNDESYQKARRERFKSAKNYRSGTQDVRQYLDMLDLDGDQSTINLNLAPVAVIPYFVDSMVEEIVNTSWQVNAKASDSIATQEEAMLKQKLMADLFKRPSMERLRKALGLMPPEQQQEALESVEEIELYMNLNYKSMVEMAAEIGVQLIFDQNDYGEIRRQMIDDTVTYGIAGCDISIQGDQGIIIHKIEPENLLTSYSPTPDYKKTQNKAYLRTMTVSDLRKTARDLSEEQLYEIATSFAGKLNNPDYVASDGVWNSTTNYYDYVYDSFQVTIMVFEFKQDDRLVHEKSIRDGYTLMSRKDEDWTPPKKSKYKKEKAQKTIENIYRGMWLVNTPYLINYDLKKNIARPNNNLSKAEHGIKLYAHGLYKNNFRSMVERMKPFADQIQINHIKIQITVAKARAAGLMIDVNALKNVDMSGSGEADTPLEVLRVYNQDGNIFYDGMDDEGVGRRPPIQELANGLNFQTLQGLINNYNFNLQMLRDVSGFIPERSGVTKNDQLVGVTERAIESSMNSTGYVVNSWINITEQVANYCTILLGDIIKFQPSIYAKALDGMTSEVIEGFRQLPTRQLGIKLEVEPDQAEKSILEQNMQAEIVRGSLTSADAHRIRNVKNLSLAYQLMDSAVKKNMRMEMKKAQQNTQMQMEQQKAATAAQTEQQMMIEKAKTEADLMKIEAQKEADLQKIHLENYYKYNIESEKNIGKQMDSEDNFNKQMQKEVFKETQKNMRDERNIEARKEMKSSKS